MVKPGASEVILFDGVCGFCQASVRFILKRDSRRRFRFAPLQSDAGHRLLESLDLSTADLDTLVLIQDGRCLTRSAAALDITRHLSGLWPLLYVLVVCPRPLRDWLYDGFARNRYRWFGRHDECFVPSVDEQGRFLE